MFRGNRAQVRADTCPLCITADQKYITLSPPSCKKINIIEVHKYLIRVIIKPIIRIIPCLLPDFSIASVQCGWYYYADVGIYVSTKLKLPSASCGDLQTNKIASDTFQTGCRSNMLTEQHVNYSFNSLNV
jgi:hypothetical protein